MRFGRRYWRRLRWQINCKNSWLLLNLRFHHLRVIELPFKQNWTQKRFKWKTFRIKLNLWQNLNVMLRKSSKLFNSSRHKWMSFSRPLSWPSRNLKGLNLPGFNQMLLVKTSKRSRRTNISWRVCRANSTEKRTWLLISSNKKKI